MLTTLVIGYGNDLRGDDAIGQQVAKAIKYCYLSMCYARHESSITSRHEQRNR